MNNKEKYLDIITSVNEIINKIEARKDNFAFIKLCSIAEHYSILVQQEDTLYI